MKLLGLMLLIFLLNYLPANAQKSKMKKEVQNIVKLGRDSIIDRALNQLDEEVDKEDFAIIKVMANNKEVMVSFCNPIKFLATNTAYCFDVSVLLLQNISSSSALANPSDFEYNDDHTPFYKPTIKALGHINFVIEAINKSHEIGSFSMEEFEDDMIIREGENHYEVSVVSDTQESCYKVKKGSGKIYDVGHAHLVPPPYSDENEENFREIL